MHSLQPDSVSSLIKDQVDWFEEYDPDPEDEETAKAEYTKQEAELLILKITEKVLYEEYKQVIKDISQFTPEEPRGCYELGRKPHWNADYPVERVSCDLPFSAFPSHSSSSS